MFQSLAGRKTYVAALITFVLGILIEADWVKIIDDPKGGLGLLAGAVVMGVMRFVTEKTTVKAAELAPPPTPPAEDA